MCLLLSLVPVTTAGPIPISIFPDSSARRSRNEAQPDFWSGEKLFTQSFGEWGEEIVGDTDQVNANGAQAPSLEVQFVGPATDRAATLRQPDSRLGLVIENRVLSAEGAPAKRHIKFQLPEDISYQSGDYLAILPSNPPEYEGITASYGTSVLDLMSFTQIILSVSSPTTLPVGKQVSVFEILSDMHSFVEIGQVATQRNIATLSEHAKDPTTRAELESLVSNYEAGQPLLSSMLDLLEKYPDIDLSFGILIGFLPSMRLRQHSISSSSLWNPTYVTLALSVVSQGQFLGVASNYLANLRKGDRVQMAVRPSSRAFHPPSDPSVPIVLFAAGSGMAPFRGLVQERAMQAQAGRHVGKCVLFFGCRKPDEDYLYSNNELKEWSVVELHPTFSRAPERSEGTSTYKSYRIWAERKVIGDYFGKDAKFYTCGGSQVAARVRDACIRIIAERKGGDEAATAEMWKTIQPERYATGVSVKCRSELADSVLSLHHMFLYQAAKID
ncbi:hypothetical protein FRC10_004602 [Ceratobasidium sp. 414]|nr:hypothetical protein FRC10_004602 [Ceratobasidium sp. 414]